MDARDNRRVEVSPRSCELCDGRDFEPLADRDRQGQPLPTVICRGCGLISHAQIPSEAELTAYYSTKYRTDYHREDTPRPTRVVRDWRRGKKLFERLSPLLEPAARVFEIGAGVGCNLKHFDLAGFEAFGIEPGAGFQKFAREQLRTRISSGRLEGVAAEPAYDLVLLVHVIEHLRSPAAAFRHIRAMLRPQGRLYVECPNVAAPHAPPGRIFHFAHIYNFAPATLTLLARRCGLRVEQAISSPNDRYLQFVFRAAEPRDVTVQPDLYQETRNAVTRFNRLSFHLRPAYLSYRCGSLSDYLSAKFLGGREYRRIMAACQRTAIPGERRAAA